MNFDTPIHLGHDHPAHEWAREMRRSFLGGGRGRRRHGHGGFGQSERGSVKYDVLAILTEGPRHGYEIMVAIEERRGFRPSPGSIYPALQMLDDGDFVNSREAEGKRVYEITDKGRDLLKTYRETPEGADSTGEPAAGVEVIVRAMRTLHSLRDAVKQDFAERRPGTDRPLRRHLKSRATGALRVTGGRKVRLDRR